MNNLSNIKDKAESFLKVITIILGFFFILGILIQNISNESLGVTTDSFLQIRSILIGLGFIAYLFIFSLFFISLILLLFLIFSPLFIIKWRTFFNYFFIPATLLIPYLLGVFLGFMFPWGRELDESNLFTKTAWTLSFLKQDITAAIDNLRLGFLHPKIKLCFLFLFLFCIINYFINRKKNASLLSKLKEIFIPQNPFQFGCLLGVLTVIIPLLFVNYGIEVYPNIKTNIGGGQPKLVELSITKNDTIFFQSTPNSSRFVLWKLGDNFTYVSPLETTSTTLPKIIAIKSNSIEKIKYMPGYVKIGNGNKIISYKLDE